MQGQLGRGRTLRYWKFRRGPLQNCQEVPSDFILLEMEAMRGKLARAKLNFGMSSDEANEWEEKPRCFQKDRKNLKIKY